MTADKYSFLDARRKAFESICEKFDEVPLAAFQQLDHRLLQELLKWPRLTPSEELICTRMLEWWRHDKDNCNAQTPDLLKLIRVENIGFEVSLAM